MTLVPRITTGLPPGVKARPRSDFIPEEFDQLIYTKGYRLWWSRAALCPCRNNEQTDQADPTCRLCYGDGVLYFLPDAAIRAGSTVDAWNNEVEVNDAGDAVLIQGYLQSLTKDPQIFERFGEWVFGTARLTVQPENRISFRDRLIMADSAMPWAQHIEYDGSAEITITGGDYKTGLRYPFISVNYFRSKETLFREGSDFELTDDGTIKWLGSSAPSADTILTIHGDVHPRWICMDHTHVLRDTLVEKGAPGPTRADQYKRLPIQAVVKLDFLVKT
jgi:hypothetical protein